MSDALRCENCAYSAHFVDPAGKNKEFGNLVCRRFPPTPYEVEAGIYKGALVTVNHNWWCGEWKAKKAIA